MGLYEQKGTGAMTETPLVTCRKSVNLKPVGLFITHYELSKEALPLSHSLALIYGVCPMRVEETAA